MTIREVLRDLWNKNNGLYDKEPSLQVAVTALQSLILGAVGEKIELIWKDDMDFTEKIDYERAVGYNQAIKETKSKIEEIFRCGYNIAGFCSKNATKDSGIAVCTRCGHTIQKEGCIICHTTYYSVCCHATMPDYPDNDICSKCGEHTSGYTQEDIDREEGDARRLLK